MKTTIQKVGIAVAVSLMTFTSCKKEQNPVLSPNSSSSGDQVKTGSTHAKSSSGFGVIALRQIPGSAGKSQINMGYSITTPGSGVFQTVVDPSGNALTYVSGVTSVLNQTTAIFGITNGLSNQPGSLFKIDVATMIAYYVGATKNAATGLTIYLQDIERTTDGKSYYAIESNTQNIYLSVPGIGAAPLMWKLVGTVPASASATSPLHGLDIYGSILVAYGNGQVLAPNPFASIGSAIGYYARFNITSGPLSYIGAAATNISYTTSSNEDAALLISDDGSINSSFIVLATPSLSFNHFYNLTTPGFGLPYLLTNVNASFGGTLPTADNGLVDYTYF